MRRFALTKAAAADLDSIATYIAQDSPEMALHVLDRLEAEMTLIAEHPGIGHMRKDLGDRRLRVWVVFSYLIVYRSGKERVQVMRVLHGSRDLRTALGRRRGGSQRG